MIMMMIWFMFSEFMLEKNHSNVRFVTVILRIPAISRYIFADIQVYVISIVVHRIFLTYKFRKYSDSLSFR